MKKKWDWKRSLSTALFLAMIVWLCVCIYENREDMQRLLHLNAGTVALLLTLALGGCVMNCVYHLLLLKTYSIKLSLTDWMGVVFVSNAIAYVLPMRADLLFTAAYYKRVKGLAYVKSVSMAAGNIVFGVAFALLQMLAALLCTGFLDAHWSLTLWGAWGLCAAALAVFIVFSLLFQDKQPKILTKYKLLRDMVEGFNALLRNRTLLGQLLVCLTLNNLMQLFLYMVCFRAIGMEITIYQALFYNSVSWLAGIVAIVPGNLGIREAVLGVAGSLMGDALFHEGFSASLLQRVAVMAVYLFAGLAFAWPVWRNWNRSAKDGIAE